MAYKCWLSLVSWSSFLIIPFTSPSGYCLSLDNDLRVRGLFGSAMKQRRGKGGLRRGPARTVRHSRGCFQTHSSPKEWDSQSNFILTFYHISRRFLLLGVNFLAPARGPGRLSYNTFRKRLGHRNGDMAVGSWSCSIVKSQSQRCGQGTNSICQSWPMVSEGARAGSLSPAPKAKPGERTLPTLGTMEEREKEAKGLLILSNSWTTVLFQKFGRAV